ncbi:MAG TPA: DUF4340 domain-containing protein, partial [Xanthomonadaceae bacterium]|nr:DUF4340 domain-containing protein [Xanthomonadaceae bacterium]
SGGAGGALDIEFDGDTWRVAQRQGYPADMERLREYLLKLAEARLVEAKTANPGNYPPLGVEDPSEEDAGGMLVTVRGTDSASSLIVGRYNGQGSGTFVRYPDQAQSWLANADLTLDREPTRWLRRDIVDLPTSQVQTLVLVRADGDTIRASKGDAADTTFKVADVPAGRELTSEFAASGLAGFLASLRLDDVRPAAAVEVPEDALTLTYDTFDGRRYAMRIWDEDGRYLLSLGATLLEVAAIEPAQDATAQAAAEEGDEAGDVAEDAEALAAQLRAHAGGEVEILNARAEGWVFQIPAFKWSAINKRMDDLLKPLDD